MKKAIMDLMDWKNVEKSMEDTIRAENVNMILNTIMLSTAKKEIKKLGGKTSEEERNTPPRPLKGERATTSK